MLNIYCNYSRLLLCILIVVLRKIAADLLGQFIGCHLRFLLRVRSIRLNQSNVIEPLLNPALVRDAVPVPLVRRIRWPRMQPVAKPFALRPVGVSQNIPVGVSQNIPKANAKRARSLSTNAPLCRISQAYLDAHPPPPKRRRTRKATVPADGLTKLLFAIFATK